MPKWLSTTIGILSVLFLLSLSVILWMSVIEFQKVEPELLSFLRDTHSGVNTTFDNLNRDCSKGKERCGSLSDLNQTLHTIRGTFGQVEIAANSFNKNQGILSRQEELLFDHTDAILSKTDTSIDSLGTVINSFTPVATGFIGIENQTSKEITTLQRTNDDLNTYLESKTLKGTLDNMYGVSESMNSIGGDISKKTHEFLYPPPCSGRLCTVKRIYSITRGITPLLEPFYYGVATYEGLKNNKQF